jgi:hypothetical protein
VAEALVLYLFLLAASCFLSQYVFFIAYLYQPGLRRGLEALYCFAHPLLYLVCIEPALEPRLPAFRPALWALFGSYWSLRAFGSLFEKKLPMPLVRGILVICLAGVGAALLRGCLSHAATVEGVRVAVPIALGGLALYATPFSMGIRQLRASRETDFPRRFFIVGRRGSLTLALAAAVAVAAGLAWWHAAIDPRGLILAHASDIRMAARANAVSPRLVAAVAFVVQRDTTTPLRQSLERVAMAGWLQDTNSHLLLSRSLDLSIGISQIRPVTALDAAQLLDRSRHGERAYWGKHYRDTTHTNWTIPAEQLTGIVEPPPANLRKERVVELLQSPEGMAARLLDQLPRRPILTIPTIVKLLETTKPTAAKAVGVLEQLGILRETTGRRRDRTFRYTAYLDRLRAGTELQGT